MFDPQPNPLTNGKIVAKNYDSRLYRLNIGKRGDASFVMSRSELVEFAKCPSRWVKGYKENEDGTDSTEWGSLIDCLLFEPSRFKERFAIKPATYTNEKGEEKPWSGNSNKCKEWLNENSDKVCISLHTYDSALIAANRLLNDKSLTPIFRNSEFQVCATAEYHDKETGIIVPIKALIDIVPGGELSKSLIDFKTSLSACPTRWPRLLFQRGYHIQGAVFLDVYTAATGEDRCEFRHLVQENFPPYEISKPILGDEFVSMGRAFYTQALRRYARCLATGNWETYDEMHRDSLSGWSLVQPEAYMLSEAA